MIKITFKEVGHGDSIIIEWLESDKNCIGIIDCNKKRSNINPVIEHIRNIEISEVKFFILSHPHYDHFSGAFQLLEYLESRSINLQKIFFTFPDPRLLTSYVFSNSSQVELSRLIEKIIYFNEVLGTKVIAIDSEGTDDIELEPDIFLEFLSPSFQEFRKYYNIEQRRLAGKIFTSQNNNPFANLLCSIISIRSKKWQVLLNSDASKGALLRVGRNSPTLNNGLKALLVQAPHHGALNNTFIRSFWEKRIYSEGKSIVFSIGDNSYHHPSFEVIRFFDENDFDIYVTNYNDELSEYFRHSTYYPNYNDQITDMLDFPSALEAEVISDYDLMNKIGDQEFVLSSNLDGFIKIEKEKVN